MKKVLKGISGAPGLGWGKAFLVDVGIAFPPRHIPFSQTAAEERRFEEAVSLAQKEFGTLSRDRRRMGAEAEALVDLEKWILEDKTLNRAVAERIKNERLSAFWAYWEETEKTAKALEASSNRFFSDRSSDLRGVVRQVLRILAPDSGSPSSLPEEAILVARHLSPMDIFRYPAGRLAGIALAEGGPTSHLVLCAASMGIPAAVGLGERIEQIDSGETVFVDGGAGEAVLSPGEEEQAAYRRFLARKKKMSAEREHWAGREGKTRDGRRVKVLANLQTAHDWEEAEKSGTEGVGLFRSEFLAAGESSFPSPALQQKVYTEILAKMKPREVTVRVFDFGAEKILGEENEENPALGLRGVRLLLQYPAIFKSQLEALSASSRQGKLRVMLPMVGGLEEFRAAKKFLKAKKIPVGIMVELPAAAVLAETFAREGDFLSVGTNDLIQYTLAVDRSNPKVAAYYEPFHPAVLRLLAQIARAGKKQKKPVSVCGQMAAHPWGIFIFVGLGITELSVPISSITGTKKTLSSIDSRKAVQTVKRLLDLATAEEIKRELKRAFPKGA